MRRAAPLPADAGPQFRRIGPADRARVSGPGLRAFRAIADAWGLTERQRLALLGEPARSTYHQWMRKAQAGETLSLPLDTLLRISAVLGVRKALAILFSDPDQGLAWLRGPHRGTVFQGAAPLEFMVEGAQDGILTVRRHLDAWRGGHPGQGGAGGFAPVVEDDLVWA
ncbi:MAG: hypothetical protein CML46_20345 [Rhodobacteraceae bacterium]|nr:hypothetical protein [Paracoccaceae bacterium]MBR29262.1 hypothetical protein [Paracoccaceae bacterium]